jgi:2-oxoglutarate/2-oxoacid ferredoxin oxidoreductase subunit beta
LIYIEPGRPSFIDLLNVVDTPLSRLGEAQVRPGREALEDIMAQLR